MASSVALREEFCVECGDPTGRSGNFHDSLVLEDEDGEPTGPFCDDCYEILKPAID